MRASELTRQVLLLNSDVRFELIPLFLQLANPALTLLRLGLKLANFDVQDALLNFKLRQLLIELLTYAEQRRVFLTRLLHVDPNFRRVRSFFYAECCPTRQR